MLGYLDFLFLSYSGRIGRTTFWVSTLVLWLLQMGAAVLLFLATGDLILRADSNPAIAQEFVTRLIVPSLIVSLVFLYPTFAIYTKRWHDRDKSGWWSMIGLVPIIGGFWMLIECGFLGGDYGANGYGTR